MGPLYTGLGDRGVDAERGDGERRGERGEWGGGDSDEWWWACGECEESLGEVFGMADGFLFLGERERPRGLPDDCL